MPRRSSSSRRGRTSGGRWPSTAPTATRSSRSGCTKSPTECGRLELDIARPPLDFGGATCDHSHVRYFEAAERGEAVTEPAATDMVVGRDAELAAVRALFRADNAAALTIEGEAGIGKTTLWRGGVAMAREAGCRVLWCRPGASEVRLAYAAIGDLLEAV